MVFFLPRKVVVLIHGRYYGGLLTTELLTEIGLAYPDDVTKVTVSFLFPVTFGKVLIYLSDIFPGVSFRHWNRERYKVSYIELQDDSPNEYSDPNSSD